MSEQNQRAKLSRAPDPKKKSTRIVRVIALIVQNPRHLGLLVIYIGIAVLLLGTLLGALLGLNMQKLEGKLVYAWALIFAGVITRRRAPTQSTSWRTDPASSDPRRQAGEEGELKVAYALQWLDNRRYVVLHDLHLKAPEYDVQQIDHLVIGPAGVFSLETKNYGGKITITPQGDWLHERTGTAAEREENVAFQAQRHHRVLQTIVGDEVPVHDLVVIANEHTIVEGREHCSVPVVHSDRLLDAIIGRESEGPLSPGRVQ